MKRLILETVGLFLGFTLLVFIFGSLVGCDSHIEATAQTGKPLGHDRFQVIEGDYSSGSEAIIVDTETGIEYLWERRGDAGGLTILIDRDGKPLVAEGYENY